MSVTDAASLVWTMDDFRSDKKPDEISSLPQWHGRALPESLVSRWAALPLMLHSSDDSHSGRNVRGMKERWRTPGFWRGRCFLQFLNHIVKWERSIKKRTYFARQHALEGIYWLWCCARIAQHFWMVEGKIYIEVKTKSWMDQKLYWNFEGNLGCHSLSKGPCCMSLEAFFKKSF